MRSAAMPCSARIASTAVAICRGRAERPETLTCDTSRGRARRLARPTRASVAARLLEHPPPAAWTISSPLATGMNVSCLISPRRGAQQRSSRLDALQMRPSYERDDRL
jgi:hypothetical protein